MRRALSGHQIWAEGMTWKACEPLCPRPAGAPPCDLLAAAQTSRPSASGPSGHFWYGVVRCTPGALRAAPPALLHARRPPPPHACRALPAGCRDYAPLLAVSCALRFWAAVGPERVREYQRETLQQVGSGGQPVGAGTGCWHFGMGVVLALCAGIGGPVFWYGPACWARWALGKGCAGLSGATVVPGWVSSWASAQGAPGSQGIGLWAPSRALGGGGLLAGQALFPLLVWG